MVHEIAGEMGKKENEWNIRKRAARQECSCGSYFFEIRNLYWKRSNLEEFRGS